MYQNEIEDKEIYNNLLEYISENAKVDLEALKTKRTYPLPLYRYGAIWYLFVAKGWGWSRIGRAIGKNHVTVMYGIKTLNNWFQTGNEKAKYIIELINNYHHA